MGEVVCGFLEVKTHFFGGKENICPIFGAFFFFSFLMHSFFSLSFSLSSVYFLILSYPLIFPFSTSIFYIYFSKFLSFF
ncbi:hypothetical protein, partial [Staphylococcus aureus]|uniref:hypothetical protein n=1 Tax=Staphylococcus aureus TaxID=1280 RepID=UPI001CC24B7B